MRLLVTGSRDWNGVYATQRVHTILELVLALSDALGQKLTVVHGDYPHGVDGIVDRWARRREDIGVSVEPYPPNWAMGPAGGPIRDRQMVNAGADLCIGFVKPPSKGTILTMQMARNAGIPTFTVMWDQEE